MFRPFCFLLVLLVSSPAAAQPIDILSTIPADQSSAQVVVGALSRLASDQSLGLRFVPGQHCDDVRQALAKVSRVAVLTTSECWKELSDGPGVEISASAGLQLHLYQRSADTPGLKPNARVGFLRMAGGESTRILLGLYQFVHDTVQVLTDAKSVARLIDGLNSGKYDAIGILEDGSGSALKELEQARVSSNTALMSVFGARTPGPILPQGAGEQSRPVLLRSASVRQSNRSANSPPTVFTLPHRDAIKAAAVWESPVRLTVSLPLVATLLAAEPTPKPKPVTVPILIAKGNLPPQLWERFATAQMSAPLAALVNPCVADHEHPYRSFIRSALADAGVDGAVALWEHAALLESRGDVGKASYASQKEEIQNRGATPAARQQVIAGLSKPNSPAKPAGDTSCKLTWRGFFRNDKLAYYQKGVVLLSQDLADGKLDPELKEFAEAADCLSRAFAERFGSTPSCREGTSGIWTTYYAPYLAATVVNTENRRVRKP